MIENTNHMGDSMPLSVTSQEIVDTFKPLGFRVESATAFDKPDYLIITHPSHRGTCIEVTIDDEENTISELLRTVNGGPESKLAEGYTPGQLGNLTDAQVGHLYSIDFGEHLDYEELDSIDELVALVQKSIVVRRVL